MSKHSFALIWNEGNMAIDVSTDNLVHKIADLEYDFFVVNNHALAIQGDDGNYYTKYIPVSKVILTAMLSNRGGLGCYQQVYRSSHIRWLCLDFDCPKDEPLNLRGLYHGCVLPVADFLDSHDINYLLEFSGRRGIHIWMVFDRLFPKSLGFKIIEQIMANVSSVQQLLNTGLFSLDKFPATGSDKRNKVGKQVKIPLSWHRKGSRSFFIDKNEFAFWGVVADNQDEWLDSDAFYKEQLQMLSEYKLNIIDDVCSKLNVKYDNGAKLTFYKQYKLVDDHKCTLESMVNILSETMVYRNIFERMKNGHADRHDWLVLLGTFSSFNECEEILTSLFCNYPSYDMEKTLKNIKRLKGSYYPATFEYLYKLYDLPLESCIEADMTGLDYLAIKLGFSVSIKEYFQQKNEKHNLQDMSILIKKELSYLLENDEVIPIDVYNKLSNIKNVEIKKLQKYVDSIIDIHNDEKIYSTEPLFELDYRIYERIEENGKKRKLVSLGVFDRLITTSLALRLCQKMNHKWDSYSYRVSFLGTGNIFYPWFSSWGRYIDSLKTYLELPFMNKKYVFYIDLKRCYDNIDILVIYENFKNSLEEDTKRAFQYLCAYNDKLMNSINEGVRLGVPQGPAYARILTEVYLDRVIRNIIEENSINDDYQIFRYVDDIVVFCDSEETAKKMFASLQNGFNKRGLHVNYDKSNYYGRIADLDEKSVDELLHRHTFNYDLVDRVDWEIIFEKEIQYRMKQYLKNNGFEIKMLGYLFSESTFDDVKMYCCLNHGGEIMGSSEGRGKYFRKFYKYLLSHNECVRKAIANGWFLEIPTGTVNFSNFINTLYYMVQAKMMSRDNVKLILLLYLNDDFEYKSVSKEDMITVRAIKNMFAEG